MIDTHIPLWGLILTGLSTVGWLIKQYIDIQNTKKDLKAAEDKIKNLEFEYKTEVSTLKSEIKHLSDLLLIVKNNVELLVLGRLKTGGKQD